MELKLDNGQYVSDNKKLVTVSGVDELIQRIEMKLRARRGDFLPMPEFGSRLYLLSRVSPSQRTPAAKRYVAEALADERGMELKGVEITETEPGKLLLEMDIIYGDEAVFVKTEI